MVSGRFVYTMGCLGHVNDVLMMMIWQGSEEFRGNLGDFSLLIVWGGSWGVVCVVVFVFVFGISYVFWGICIVLYTVCVQTVQYIVCTVQYCTVWVYST